MTPKKKHKFLYIFLDEGGNFDFSPSGTKYFTLTSLTKERPFYACKELGELKYNLIEGGMDIEYFHASEDRQPVRDEVFKIIKKNLRGIRLDSIIVEKRKTNPSLYSIEKFYPKILGYLLEYISNHINLSAINKFFIFTDAIPEKKRRKAIEKAIKTTIKHKIKGRVSYRIFHHKSKSNFDLQITDYCNWAIYRKWDSNDFRSYNYIKDVIKSEFNIFQTGKTYFY